MLFQRLTTMWSESALEEKQRREDGGRKEGGRHGSVVPVCLCTGICRGQHKGASVLSETHTAPLSLLTQQVWSLCLPSSAAHILANTHSPVLSFPPGVFRPPLISSPPLLPLHPSPLLAELFMVVHCAKRPVHCWYRRIHFIRALCVVVCVCAWTVCVYVSGWLVGIMGRWEAGYRGNWLKASERKGRWEESLVHYTLKVLRQVSLMTSVNIYCPAVIWLTAEFIVYITFNRFIKRWRTEKMAMTTQVISQGWGCSLWFITLINK